MLIILYLNVWSLHVNVVCFMGTKLHTVKQCTAVGSMCLRAAVMFAFVQNNVS